MEELFAAIGLFPSCGPRSASARSHLSRPLSPPPDAPEEEKAGWLVIPCPDFLDRSKQLPRDIEIFDFIVPFHIFTVLIDLRDHLRWQFSLPEPEPEIFPGRPLNRPMSKARAEETVTNVMERMKFPFKRLSDHDPYRIKGRQLASYISTTTGMKVQLPYELCDVMLATSSDDLIINDVKVKREVLEAILQCRLHEEEGVFIDGIVFESGEVRKETEIQKAKEHLAALDLEEASKSTAATSATTADSANTSDATTPLKRPPYPGISYARSAGGKILGVDTIPPAPQRHSISEEDSMRSKPFIGYEPKDVAEMAEYYCRVHLNLPVIIEESLVRLLFGMPERGRTLKVGGPSGWGKYGKDIKMRLDYFIE